MPTWDPEIFLSFFILFIFGRFSFFNYDYLLFGTDHRVRAGFLIFLFFVSFFRMILQVPVLRTQDAAHDFFRSCYFMWIVILYVCVVGRHTRVCISCYFGEIYFFNFFVWKVRIEITLPRHFFFNVVIFGSVAVYSRS